MRRQVGEPGIEQLLGGRAGRAYDDLPEVLAMAVVRVLQGALEVAAVQLEGGGAERRERHPALLAAGAADHHEVEVERHVVTFLAAAGAALPRAEVEAAGEGQGQ